MDCDIEFFQKVSQTDIRFPFIGLFSLRTNFDGHFPGRRYLEYYLVGLSEGIWMGVDVLGLNMLFEPDSREHGFILALGFTFSGWALCGILLEHVVL